MLFLHNKENVKEKSKIKEMQTKDILPILKIIIATQHAWLRGFNCCILERKKWKLNSCGIEKDKWELSFECRLWSIDEIENDFKQFQIFVKKRTF